MLKRLGLYSAALFATLALMQLPAASAQNRDGGGRIGYNTRQTSNRYATPAIHSENNRNMVQSHADSRDNESHMMRSNRDHDRNVRYRHFDDNERWERR